MKLIISLGITLCFLQYVSPVDIPAIFQKPKKKLDIPTPKSLDIREATSEEYDCVGKPDGNNVNPNGDCKSFFACVKNTTYFVVCPEFPAYQTYFNPVRKLCDKSDPLACLQALEALDVKEENDESEKKSVQDDDEEEKTKKDSKESNDDEESKKGKYKKEDTKSDETEGKSSVDDNNSEETEDTVKSNSSEEDSSEENEKDEL